MPIGTPWLIGWSEKTAALNRLAGFRRGGRPPRLDAEFSRRWAAPLGGVRMRGETEALPAVKIRLPIDVNEGLDAHAAPVAALRPTSSVMLWKHACCPTFYCLVGLKAGQQSQGLRTRLAGCLTPACWPAGIP